MPVAVFAMGPRTDTEDAWQHSRAQLDRALAKRDWLNPVAVSNHRARLRLSGPGMWLSA